MVLYDHLRKSGKNEPKPSASSTYIYEQAEEKAKHMNKSKGKILGDANAVDEDE